MRPAPEPALPAALRSVLWRLYAYNFCGDFVLIYPLYALMMEQHGLTPLELSTLFIVWSVTAFAAEVPTGVLADRYPRRWLLAVNGVLTGLGYLSWLVFPGFWGYLAGFVLWGIGGSCASGAYEALLYDELAASGYADRFTKVYGQSRAAAFCGIVCAGLGASAAVGAGWGYPALLVASACSGLAVTLVALSLPAGRPSDVQSPASGIKCAGAVETSPDAPPLFSVGQSPADSLSSTPDSGRQTSDEGNQPDSYWRLLKNGLVFALRSRRLLWLMLIIGIATSIYGCLEEYFALLARDSGLPERWQGLLMALIAGSQALAASQAWRFTRSAGLQDGSDSGSATLQSRSDSPPTALDIEPPYGHHEPGRLSSPIVPASPNSPIPVALLLGGSALLLLSAALWHTPLGLIGLILFCCVYTIAETQLASQLQTLLPDSQRATLTSLSSFGGEIFGVLVYLSVGVMATRWSYAAAFAAGAGVLLLAAGEYWRGGRDPNR